MRKLSGSAGMLYCYDREGGSIANDVHRRTKSNS